MRPPSRARSERKQSKTDDPYVAGQGGKQHKYLQQLIREAAQERGFKAMIEAQVAGGSVDVAIEGLGTTIACEVSVTTDASHELGNVLKGLAAGFAQVWLVAASARRRITLERAIVAHLPEELRDRFKMLSIESLIEALDEIVSRGETQETTVRGYSVKVKRTPLDAEEARKRREAITRVVARSVKNLSEKE